MAHTAHSLEGAILDVITAVFVPFGINMVDPFLPDPSIGPIVGPPPYSQTFARVRFDNINFNTINSLAAITALQVSFFHIDVWGQITAGTTETDNRGGLGMSSALLLGFLGPEPAVPGDWGWNNITGIKILHCTQITYDDLHATPQRTYFCAATWN